MVQEAGCVQAVSVPGTDRDCTPTHQTTTESEVQPHLSPTSVASYSCSHWPSYSSSDDWQLLPSTRLSLELAEIIGQTKRGVLGVGRGLERDQTLPKSKNSILGNKWTFYFWPRGTKVDADNILYFCFALFCRCSGVNLWYVVICWAGFNGLLQWRGLRKTKKEEKEQDRIDDWR